MLKIKKNYLTGTQKLAHGCRVGRINIVHEHLLFRPPYNLKRAARVG